MRCWKRVAYLALVALCALVCGLCALALPAYAAQQEVNADVVNRFNVVLVTDASGSMKETDPDGLRFRSMASFLYLLTLEGNNVGSVSFGEGIPLKTDMTDLSDKASRDNLIQQNRDVELEDWTNIGEGLQTAVSMLNDEGDPNLPSIILLLSDGNTDMPDSDALQASLQAKSDAIESARQAGISVYTVSLNANGEANSSELQQIASATGGEFREVTSADDLTEVYRLYQQIIFGSVSTPGAAEGTFDIAKIGVEEVNIAITGVPTEFIFVSPDGQTLPPEQLAGTTFATDGLTVVKIEDPQPGTWHYKVADVSDDSVSVDIVRNINVKAMIDPSVPSGEIKAGDSVDVTALLLEAGEPVDASAYADFTGTLAVTDADGAEQTTDLTAGDNGFAGTIPFPDEGTYTVTATITGEGFTFTTNPLTYNVGNAAPVPADSPLEQTVYLLPFVDNTTTIDLSSGATDSEDSTLSYEVESSAYMPDEYCIDGSNLVISSFSLPQGSFTIQAADSDGATCTFDVQITVINVGLVTLITIGVGVLVFLIVTGILLWIALNKRFYGTCYVRPFNNEEGYAYYEEESREKGRGRIKLSSFGVETFGVNPDAYFQATGKSHVEFKAKKPFYAGGSMVKKVEVPGNGYEVMITTDQTARKGIVVRFQTRKLR